MYKYVYVLLFVKLKEPLNVTGYEKKFIHTVLDETSS